MGYADTYCYLCGCCLHGIWHHWENEFDEPVSKWINITQWMNDCTILLRTQEVIENVRDEGSGMTFDKDGKEFFVYPERPAELSTDTLGGIVVHTDCLKFIKNKYKIELKYNDLPDIYKIGTPYCPLKIDYGEVENYQNQDFEWMEIIKNKKMQYILDSPLKNSQKQKYIINIINQLKIKMDPKRKSPLCSATLFEPNTIKLGHDNKFWIVNKNKWIYIPVDEIFYYQLQKKFNANDTKMKQIIKYLDKLKRLGESCSKNHKNNGNLLLVKVEYKNKTTFYVDLISFYTKLTPDSYLIKNLDFAGK